MTKPLTNAQENPHAGRGSSVLLDIGDDVGAIVIAMPPELEDEEVELRPTHSSAPAAQNDHHHHFPHVAVVPRPSPDGEIIHSAVFFEVPTGRYELYLRPDGPVQLLLNVVGGEVTNATWPQ